MANIQLGDHHHRPSGAPAFEQALREVRALATNAAAISYTTRGETAAPREYTVELRVTSVSGLSRAGTPVFARVFRFDVVLSENYPRTAPLVRVRRDSATPFHPHFTTSWPFRRARWIDYRTAVDDESLATLLTRIVQSLQYRPAFVNPSAARIANPRALAWYSLARLQHPQWFPTDHAAMTAHAEPLGSDRRRLSMSTPASVPARSSAKRFEITATTPAYEVTSRSRNDALRALSIRSYASAEADASHELYIEQRAMQDLLAHIEWGLDSPRNRVEQGGLLLGHVYSDPHDETVYGVVSAVIPGARAKGSGAYLLMDHETWKAMLDHADDLNAASGGPALQVIGWYHTHPHELSVFLSGTDRATQARMFSQPWQFAVVLNPQKTTWRVFHGGAAVECVGFMAARP